MKHLPFLLLLLSSLSLYVSCQTTQDSSANTATVASTSEPHGSKGLDREGLSEFNKQLLLKEKAGDKPPNGFNSWTKYWREHVLKAGDEQGKDYGTQTLKFLELDRMEMGLPSVLL